MENLFIFLGFVSILIVGVLIFAYKKHGNLKTFVKNGAVWGVVYAVLAMGGIGGLLLIFSKPANSAEIEYFKYSQVFLGIETNAAGKQSPQCAFAEDSLTSNLGFTQHLIGAPNVDVLGTYQHHSCVVGKDSNTYDMFGVKVIMTIPW